MDVAVVAFSEFGLGVNEMKMEAGAMGRLESARYLSLSTRTLDKLAADGELPRIKIGAKR